MIKKMLVVFLLFAALCSLLCLNVLSAQEAEVTLGTTIGTASITPLDISSLGPHVSVLTSNDIKQSHKHTVGELLGRQPGLFIPDQPTLGNNQSLSIRGSSSQHVLVLLNGVPMNSPSLGTADLSQFPLDNVERIEIYRGTASSVHGAQAIGGIVNIITIRPEGTTKAHVDILSGSFNTQTYRFNFSAKPGNFDYALSGGRAFSSGWRKNNDSANNTVSVQLGYDLKKAARLSVFGQLYRSGLGLPGPSNVPIEQWDNSLEREASSPNARQEDHDTVFSADYQDRGNSLSPNVKVYEHSAKQIYRNSDWNIDDLRRTASQGVHISLIPLINTAFSAEVRKDKLHQRDNNAATDKIHETLTLNSAAMEYTIKSNPLLLLLGARFDHHSLSGNQVSPRASFLWNDIFPKWKLAANGATGFRPPSLNDLFWPRQEETFFGTTYITEGNRNLDPEKSFSLDVGVENKTDSYTAKATVFYLLTDDLIYWDSQMLTLTSIRYRPENIAKAKHTGLELSFEQALTSFLHHSVQYTAMYVAGKRETDESYQLLAFRPKHILAYNASWTFSTTWKAIVENRWNAKSYERDGEKGKKIPSANILTLGLEKKILTSTLSFKVENILNKRYAHRTDGFGSWYPLPGRTYWASLNLFFEN